MPASCQRKSDPARSPACINPGRSGKSKTPASVADPKTIALLPASQTRWMAKCKSVRSGQVRVFLSLPFACEQELSERGWVGALVALPLKPF